MKEPLLHRFHHLAIQDEIIHIGRRDDDSLIPGKPFFHTDLKETLYLFLDPAHGLNFPLLTDGPGNRHPLFKGDSGKGRKQGEKLGA